jgi:flagellar protein FlaG
MLTEPVKAAARQISSTEQARRPTASVLAEKDALELNSTPDVSSDALREIAKDLQSGLNMIHNVDLQFSVHASSGRMMVIVKEASTGQVIREIPPREILNLAAKLDEMIGLIFDERG